MRGEYYLIRTLIFQNDKINDSVFSPRYFVLENFCKVYYPYLSVAEIDYLSMCEDLRGNVIENGV